MTDIARRPAEAETDLTPLPELILYSRSGCHLCDDARQIVTGLLADRRARGLPSPTLVERDIATDPDWERRYLATIPVLEIGDRRLELATGARKIGRFLDQTA